MMMKHIFCFTLLMLAKPLFSQCQIPPTEKIRITGEIKKEKELSLKQLEALEDRTINDLVIYNHEGEIKDTLTGLKGVLLKNVLEDVDFVYDKPKELNAFCIVLIASDGYTVVYSWNEIFNTPTGDHIFLLTEMEGHKIRSLPERLVCISTGDLQSGRRYVKGLERIEIRKLNSAVK